MKKKHFLSIWLAFVVICCWPANEIRAALVAHWTFDETSGSTAHDTVGSYHGTLVGGAIWVPSGGRSGGAISLARTSGDYVTMGDVLNLGAGPSSFVAWIKTTTTDTDTFVLAKHWSTFTSGYIIGINLNGSYGASNKAWFYNYYNGDEPISTTSVNDDQWHQIIATRGNGQVKIYVDGLPVEDSKTDNGLNDPPAGTPLVIGGYFYGAPISTYTGLIDEVRIYDHMLSDEEIQLLYDFVDDTTAPTGYFEVFSYYGEVSGDQVGISVSTNDDESLVKDVCLWLGDGESNLIEPAMCKTLAEREWNSYDYAPSFAFSWDSTTVADGTYNLYVIATDNANNVGKLGPIAMTVNNYSLGSPSQPAPITTCQEFQNINNHGGWHYEIKNDIDCAETKNWNGGKGFLPITFGGVLNGNNFTISSLNMNADYTGIFGQIDSGSRISGVNFRNVELIGSETYGGGFSRYNWGTIEKSSITGSMQLINGATCGGFASQNSGTISQSWGDMTVGTGGYIGGIAGHNYDGLIENCYFKGEVLSGGSGGGLVGLNEGWLGSGAINNSYSTAKISSGSGNGGMIGWQYQRGTQSGSYWNVETSGFNNMCGSDALGGTNCDDSHGLTDTQMKTQASFIGWDFDNIWKIDPNKNDGYPYLAWQSFSEKKNFPWPMFLPAITHSAQP